MRLRFQWISIALLALAGCEKTEIHAPTDTTVAVADSVAGVDSLDTDAPPKHGIVQADMRNVDMHIEPGIVLGIKRLRGTLHSTRTDAPPALNDKSSMILVIRSGDITIDTVSLDNLLNKHVFGYPKSPLKNLHVTIDGNEMVQAGSLKKLFWLRFKMRASVSLTPKGEIRIHPTSLSMFGMGIMGLSKRLGGLSGLSHIEDARGARLDGDDLILDPVAMLPPPTILGTLTSIALTPGGMRQTFGTGDSVRTAPAHRPGSTAKNYMYFHGGTLRFGKLTMADTDLEIVDANPSNPFDYMLDRYQDHLVAGHSNTTPVDGLIVVMPDLQQLPPSTASRGKRRPAANVTGEKSR